MSYRLPDSDENKEDLDNAYQDPDFIDNDNKLDYPHLRNLGSAETWSQPIKRDDWNFGSEVDTELIKIKFLANQHKHLREEAIKSFTAFMRSTEIYPNLESSNLLDIILTDLMIILEIRKY